MKLLKFCIYTTLILGFTSCATYKKPYIRNSKYTKEQKLPDNKLIHTAYLIGDAGGLDNYDTESNIVFDEVAKELDPNNKNQSIIFLGDNIYHHGLESLESVDRKKQEQILNTHLNLAQQNKGLSFFIPGNHDWNDGKPGGRENTIRQYKYVNENRSHENISFYPKNACGDPEVVEISKDIVYIFIDSNWWLSRWEKENEMNDGCEITSRRAFADKIFDLFSKYKNDQIIVFLHHPFFTNGSHGGKFSLKEHLFPLTALNKNAYVPLPGLGSIMPIARNLGVNRQDVSNPLYQELHNVFKEAISISGSKRIIFASGHEHAQQHFKTVKRTSRESINHLISGTGYKTSYAQRGNNAEFVYSKRGYQVLRFYEDQNVWLDIISVDKNSKKKKLEYRRNIVKPLVEKTNDYKYNNVQIKGDTTAIPLSKFKASGTKKWFMGSQYRDVWTLPTTVKLIDLEKYDGGLKPLKIGGGKSSLSLRLEDENGKQYVLRRVVKEIGKVLPKNYRDLIWLNVMNDQFASAIPYGALIFPKLSQPLDIYHTDQKLFYLKNQKSLMHYNDVMEEGLYLLEKRYDGKNWKDDDSLDNPDEIISYLELIDKLQSKTNHFVDQKWVLKSRLFDMWVHDWDRHDDQWRWAAYKDGHKTIYRPIPRDRDWAFFKYEGLAYSTIAKFYYRRYRSFQKEVKDIIGLNLQAAHFDRYFLNEMTWEDWEKAAVDMQKEISEEDIDNALQAIPAEAQKYLNAEIKQKLMHRLEDMTVYARKYYDILNQEVTVVGTNKPDIFKIDYKDQGVLVECYRDSKKYGKVLKYRRHFDFNITNEIRLFGLADNDKFEISGTPNQKIKLRIIGGIGLDSIVNKTNTPQLKRIIIYDEISGIYIPENTKTKTFINNEIGNNEYNRYQFKYDSFFPFFSIGNSFDEGIWLGASFVKTIHGFRKEPFKSQHRFSARFSPVSLRTFNLEYSGSFIDVLSSEIAFFPELYFSSPSHINFFGFNNELEPSNSNRQFNWVNITSAGIKTLIGKSWNDNRLKFAFGPLYEIQKINLNEGRVLDTYQYFGEQGFEADHLLGLETTFKAEVLDNPINPNFGFKLDLSTSYKNNIVQNSTHVLHLSGSICFYIPLYFKPQITLANRIGFSHAYGQPELYQLPSLGNNTYLRPFRNDRFRGDRIFYHQIDMRVEILYWKNKVFPMKIGLNAGFDYASTYNQLNNERDWNQGYSAGLSFNIMNLMLIHPYMTFSKEGSYFNLSSGFIF